MSDPRTVIARAVSGDDDEGAELADEVLDALTRDGYRINHADDPEEERWNKAIDRILNSGLLCSYMDDFWRFVDGELTYDEFSKRMSP